MFFSFLNLSNNILIIIAALVRWDPLKMMAFIVPTWIYAWQITFQKRKERKKNKFHYIAHVFAEIKI